MKILTNIRFAQTAGIAQTLFTFLKFIKGNKKDVLDVAGVNVIDRKNPTYKKNKNGNVSIISIGINVPSIKDVLENAESLDDVKESYASVIEAYRSSIKKEKPDVVLVNGTYYMPWCLFIASQEESIPVVLHYHGVLMKETENWPAKQRNLFRKMELSFDKEGLFYIFPSKITKELVEKELYKHKIGKFAIIPNPAPLHFFENKKQGNKINIGIVSRWTGIKNPEFCEMIAKYNKEKGGKFVINLVTDFGEKDKRHKKLSKLMKIHPAMSNEKLVDFYKNMGVVISPSHFETYGNVAKEALACGIPAIVSGNMGVSETFKRMGLSKWIIDFKSVKKVYRKIEEVIGISVEKKIREKIKKLYSPDVIFNKMINILLSEKIQS